ncbi:MAG: cyanoexosortase B [Synechococcales bacterium]|nr:cyanoexosortase B [Synechococcales bacterium]
MRSPLAFPGWSHLSTRLRQSWLVWTIGALVGLLYGPLLWHWVDGWLKKTISIEHEYFSHGLIGLPFAAYLAWSFRHHWRKLPHPSLLAQAAGFGLCAIAAGLYQTGLPDLVNVSLPMLLVGMVGLWKGLPGLKLQWFPLLLVLLATPNELPYLITPYTLPLQSFIAHFAGFLLTIFGMDVTVEQINIFVNDRQVEVAPYCAGLKMMFTSLYVALMLLYWTNLLRSRSATFIFFIITIILSIAANIVRNTALTFFHGTEQDGLFVWLHDSWGGDLYSAGLLGLLVMVIGKIEQWYEDRAIAPAGNDQ